MAGKEGADGLPEIVVSTKSYVAVTQNIPLLNNDSLIHRNIFRTATFTELGAKRVGVIQTLLTTCKVQGVDAYTYLVDVLQRVGEHPAKRVIELTPRVWKTKFADQPLRSDLDLVRDPPGQ